MGQSGPEARSTRNTFNIRKAPARHARPCQRTSHAHRRPDRPVARAIALYPDPLLSLIFPAATYPQDVVAAEQWLAATPNPTEADIVAQGWDDSIKGLVHYPTVLQTMSNQIDWTQALGAAL